jgi:uncharacterized protein
LLGEALEGLDVDLGRTAGAVHLELSKSGDDDIYVHGSIQATIGLPCGACLQPARIDVSVPVKMAYVYGEEKDAEDEALIDPTDESDVGQHDGVRVDLEPMIREQLILSVPMAPRCKENCRGLCPVCGENRNQVSCGHSEQSVEKSPFGALKGLKLE